MAGFVPKHSVTVCDFPGSTAFAFVKATSHLFGQLTPSPSAVVLVVLFFRSTKSRTGLLPVLLPVFVSVTSTLISPSAAASKPVC